MPGSASSFARAWSRTAESLLRGLNHALSNRVATIGTVAEMLASGDDVEQLGSLLSTESKRLEQVLLLLRMLPTEHESRTEAVRLRELVDEALALHQHHPDGRDFAYAVHARGTERPVLAERQRLLRIVLVLLEAAARWCLANGERTIQLWIASGARGGAIEVRAGTGASTTHQGDDEPAGLEVSWDELPSGITYVVRAPALPGERGAPVTR